MSLDISRLTPAPWRYSKMTPADWEFYELARNAFDVMMRRRWWFVPCKNGWKVRFPERDYTFEEQVFADPFTALVEADCWYVANVERIRETP